MSTRQNVIDEYEDMLKDKGYANLNQISDLCGCSVATVRKHLRSEYEHLKVKGRGRPSVATAVLETKVISEVHRRLGVRVVAWRLDGTAKNPTELGERIKLSSHRMNAIENGTYDLRLSELIRLYKAMGFQEIKLEIV